MAEIDNFITKWCLYHQQDDDTWEPDDNDNLSRLEALFEQFRDWRDYAKKQENDIRRLKDYIHAIEAGSGEHSQLSRGYDQLRVRASNLKYKLKEERKKWEEFNTERKRREDTSQSNVENALSFPGNGFRASIWMMGNRWLTQDDLVHENDELRGQIRALEIDLMKARPPRWGNTGQIFMDGARDQDLSVTDISPVASIKPSSDLLSITKICSISCEPTRQPVDRRTCTKCHTKWPSRNALMEHVYSNTCIPL
ncbi:hypothetical protein QBC46DRAFT_359583 [Diplogelasinospora grovesii]|uniref:Uncharacterized protein n=1 Tax=Diplogelasinospora grovesii TaxID=303347 RepID=A0AAN6MV69_9PEZI|nr:hypothetical protein QBC46DRAFT_359583 [Diplogelasinospora grovesii]